MAKQKTAKPEAPVKPANLDDFKALKKYDKRVRTEVKLPWQVKFFLILPVAILFMMLSFCFFFFLKNR